MIINRKVYLSANCGNQLSSPHVKVFLVRGKNQTTIISCILRAMLMGGHFFQGSFTIACRWLFFFFFNRSLSHEHYIQCLCTTFFQLWMNFCAWLVMGNVFVWEVVNNKINCKWISGNLHDAAMCLFKFLLVWLYYQLTFAVAVIFQILLLWILTQCSNGVSSYTNIIIFYCFPYVEDCGMHKRICFSSQGSFHLFSSIWIGKFIFIVN